MKRWIVVILLMLAAGAAAGWWAFGQSKPAAAPRTVAVQRGTIEQTVLATGTIEASSLVTVGAEVSGRIESLPVELGQQVEAGDLIAQIDSLNQENAVRSAEAALANIRAQRTIQEASLAQARQALTRSEELHRQKLVSEADYQSAQLAAQTAEGQLAAIDAQIAQAQVNVEAAQLNLERTRIVAPVDGTIVAIAVQAGQSVNSNSSTPTIVKIANLDQMLVKAEISEADVPHVQAGQAVYLTILGEPDNRISATLRTIEPAPDSILSESTGSSSSSSAIYYNGRFDVPNPDHKLRISMTAQVTIVLAAAENVLTIPSAALGRAGPGGRYLVEVWNAATQTSESRPVEIGLDDKVTAEVVSGLEEGELVVVASSGGASAAAATGQRSSGRGAGGLLGMGGGGPPMGGGGPPPM